MPRPFPKRPDAAVLFAVRGVLAISAIVATIHTQWMPLFAAVLALALTYLPHLLRRWHVIDLPLPFEVGGAVFVFLSVFLGNLGYYARYWWWDIFLHGTSAIVIGIAGYLLLSALMQASRSRASPWLVGVFTVSFALGIGALWEIVEFTIDTTLGTNMQVRQSGVVDTMSDLIMDTLGALIAGIAAGLHARGVAGWGVLSRLRSTFRSNNPELFRRRPPKSA